MDHKTKSELIEEYKKASNTYQLMAEKMVSAKNIDKLGELKNIGDKYQAIIDQLIEKDVAGTIDPGQASCCSLGESCCTGTERTRGIDELINPVVLEQLSTQKATLVKEFQTAYKKYNTVLAELLDRSMPGVIDPIALTCSCGDSCGSGSFDTNLAELSANPVDIQQATKHLQK